MERSLVSSFWDVATRYSDRVAIIDTSRSVRYETLAIWVMAISAYLQKEGLRAGDRVAVLVQNSAEYAAIYYGILAAGGVVVALNTAAKARDLSNWLSHSECGYLFAQSKHPELSELAAGTVGRVRVIEVGAERAEHGVDFGHILSSGNSERMVPSGNEARSLAAIIYTSGTTGRPKGVTLSHLNLYSNTRSIVEYLGITCDDRAMNVLPFYFSYGNSVLHTHLAVGGTIVLENSLLYPHRVLERMVEERVTGFCGVPTTYTLLLSRTRIEEYDLASLRYMTQAGGPMAPASIERLRTAVPNAEFFVMYGQTEASARLSYLPPQRLDEKMGSVGIPIPDVELDVQDEHQASVAPHVTGEIWARGPNIMMGYWRDPEMTEAVLQNGWLRTGDLAYRDEDGYLFIVGRSSDMIKSGAYRVSPKEIEEVILELDGLEEVAVIGVPDEHLGEVIKAIVVPAPVDAPGARSIQAHCRANLATYKIPKAVEFVKEIPKTSSGKVLRYLLQQQSMEQR